MLRLQSTDQFHLKHVKIRVVDRPECFGDVSIGHVNVLIRDLVGRYVQIPPRVLVGFEPECGSDGSILVEFVDSCGDDSPAPRRATRKPRRSIRGSRAAELTVPEIVGRLAAIGAERYHVD